MEMDCSCALFLDLYKSDNETFSGQASVEEEETELIFVHIGAKEFTIPCNPEKTDAMIGMNSTYKWSLENRGDLTLSGASLILHEFRAEDSGHYTCSISFTEEDQLHTVTFSHIVVGYHIRGELQVLLIFQSNSCDNSLMHEFVKILHTQLSQLVSHLHCELLSESTTCFPTVEKPLDEFNLQVELKVMIAFAVPPLGCLCLIVLCCYCFRRRWQKHHSSTKVDGQTKVQEETPPSDNDTALVATEEQHSLPLPFSTSEHPNNEGGMSPPHSKLEPQALPGLANPGARSLLSS
ncbi:zona pellucida-binding protein 2-like [Crotalus adamanteus]|uniref:Zona pellucida-binding protein 2-like n=1 Tax=Crotalus adamanteus TaxID=8729 RepID=A0AAW1BSG8_CROAD